MVGNDQEVERTAIRAGMPFDASTRSPRANRYARLGEDRFPNAFASIDSEVWTCVSPQ